MNNLLFYSLVIALSMLIIDLLSQQKKLTKPTNTRTKSTQTNISDNENNPELENALEQLIQNIKKLNSEL